MPSTLTLIGDTFQARIGIWKKIVVDKTTQDVNTFRFYMIVYLSSVSFQIVARVLQPQGVTVGIVNVAESMELAQSMGGYPFNLYLIYLK